MPATTNGTIHEQALRRRAQLGRQQREKPRLRKATWVAMPAPMIEP